MSISIPVWQRLVLIIDRLLLLIWPGLFIWGYWFVILARGHGAIGIGTIVGEWREFFWNDDPWLLGLVLVFVPALSCVASWLLCLFSRRTTTCTIAVACALAIFSAALGTVEALSELHPVALTSGRRLVGALVACAAHLFARTLVHRRRWRVPFN